MDVPTVQAALAALAALGRSLIAAQAGPKASPEAPG